MCVFVCVRERACGNENSPLFLLNWASRRHTLIISTAGTGDRPSGGVRRRKGADRGGHTHINTDTHTDTQQRAKQTLMLMQKSTSRSENKRGYKHKHTHTPERAWQPAIHPTTQDDILPAQQEREQPSTLMRRLTFSRLWHIETEQFRLIRQISCFCQALAHNGVRYLFPCIPLSHITVPTRNTTESSMEYSRTRVHTQPLTHVVNLATIRKARKNKVKGSIWLLRSSTYLPRYRQRDAF